jgi:serine/threonine protein kinase
MKETKWSLLLNCKFYFLISFYLILFNNYLSLKNSLSGGELFEKISDPNYKMTEPEAKRYIKQLCEGLQNMHENNIVHLDIKPENILFESKTSPNIKLVDFGLATKLDPDEVVKVSSATIEFAAPEIVEKDAVGFATDMWAVGVLTYVL